MQDILERLANTSANESSEELQCRCFDVAAEISNLRAAMDAIAAELIRLRAAIKATANAE